MNDEIEISAERVGDEYIVTGTVAGKTRYKRRVKAVCNVDDGADVADRIERAKRRIAAEYNGVL